MNLDELSRRTGLPIGRIRYVVQHGLLPGVENRGIGHRVPREFTQFESFGIACAAALLGAGLRGPVVRDFLWESTLVGPLGEVPLQRAFLRGTKFLIGTADVGWRFTDEWPSLADGTSSAPPFALICLNVATLRERLSRSPAERGGPSER